MIAGPTAVGKTAAGIFLAKMTGGEIVSCDSMQIYREPVIAVSKPSSEELAAVPHYLIGDIPVSQQCDAAVFRSLAQSRVDEILSRGRVPVIVGGTGMYIKVLLDGIFDEPEIPDYVRKDLEDEALREGSARLYEELQEKDPEAARKIHAHDIRRIVRALEVCRWTGEPVSRLQKTAQGLWGRYDIVMFGLRMDRERLYARIDNRVDRMVDAGLVEEIRALLAGELSRTARAIIGLKEIGAYLSGEISLDDAKAEMKKNTRRLAKRQMTWFRAEKRIHWIDGVDRGGEAAAAQQMFRIYNGEDPCLTQDK